MVIGQKRGAASPRHSVIYWSRGSKIVLWIQAKCDPYFNSSLSVFRTLHNNDDTVAAASQGRERSPSAFCGLVLQRNCYSIPSFREKRSFNWKASRKEVTIVKYGIIINSFLIEKKRPASRQKRLIYSFFKDESEQQEDIFGDKRKLKRKLRETWRSWRSLKWFILNNIIYSFFISFA